MILEEEGSDEARERVLGRLFGITVTFEAGGGADFLRLFRIGRGTEPGVDARLLILGRGTAEAAGAGARIRG